MSIRLESFQFIPRGVNGWGTGLLHFGRMFTAVQGANGTGKTPIMKGIMLGLGHELDIPPEIVNRCQYAQTTLSVDGRLITLTRQLDVPFGLSVDDQGVSQKFVSQSEYAKWFIRLFTQEARVLTNKQHQAAELYTNVLFPAVWVDQDHGWTTDYWTPPNRNFIIDQREEVIRFLLGLPARHPYRERTAFDDAKKILERTEQSIEMQRFVIERLKSNSQLSGSEEHELVARKEELQRELNLNSEVLEAIRSATVYFDRDLEALQVKRDEMSRRVSTLKKRQDQLRFALSELSGEEDILAANVQAGDLLRQFCTRDGCQMFAPSERSYGRSLLFLRDQIKDMNTLDRELSSEIRMISEQLGALDAEGEKKRSERRTVIDASPQANALAKIRSLTQAVVEVELRLAKIQQYRSEFSKFERLLEQRDQAVGTVSETRPTGVKIGNLANDRRRVLGDKMTQWLMTLGTQNTKEASFDNEFGLLIDGEKFTLTTHQSGSTRTRIVLAFHAALLEVSLLYGGNHPGWLLFDAPKQHELSQTDFDAYAARLQSVAALHPDRVQVVFSVADLKTQFEADDEVWLPRFTIDGNIRFLGPAPQQEQNQPPPA